MNNLVKFTIRKLFLLINKNILKKLVKFSQKVSIKLSLKDQISPYHCIIFLPIFIILGVYIGYFTNHKVHLHPSSYFNIGFCILIALSIYTVTSLSVRRYLFLSLAGVAFGFVAVHIKFQTSHKFDGYEALISSSNIEIIDKYQKNGKTYIIGQAKINTSFTPETTQAKDLKRLMLIDYNDLCFNANIGSTVNVTSSLFSLPKKTLPTAYPYEDFLLMKGINAMGILKSCDIQIQSNLSVNFKIKEYLTGIMERSFIAPSVTSSVDVNGISKALFLGDKSDLSREVYDDFRNSGIAHILAISGLHIGLIMMTIGVICRYLLAYTTKIRNPRRTASIVAIVFGMGYIYILGFPVPATRSFIMVSSFLIANIAYRIPDPKRAITFACLVLLVVSPSAVLFASFQLSFTAILGLGIIYNYYDSNKSLIAKVPKIVQYIIIVISTSVFASLVTAPLVIHHFGSIARLSILTNLIAIPIISFITIPIGIIAIIISLLHLNFVAIPLFDIAQLTVFVVGKAAHFISSISSPMIFRNWHGSGILLYCVALFCTVAGTRIIRILGIIGIIVSIVAHIFDPIPQLVADPKGLVFAESGEYYFIKPNPNQFTESVWMQELGKSKFLSYLDEKSPSKDIQCWQTICKIEKLGVIIAKKRLNENFLRQLCNEGWIIINQYDYSKRFCGQSHISLSKLYDETFVMYSPNVLPNTPPNAPQSKRVSKK